MHGKFRQFHVTQPYIYPPKFRSGIEGVLPHWWYILSIPLPRARFTNLPMANLHTAARRCSGWQLSGEAIVPQGLRPRSCQITVALWAHHPCCQLHGEEMIQNHFSLQCLAAQSYICKDKKSEERRTSFVIRGAHPVR